MSGNGLLQGNCPLPREGGERVLLGHGSGGRLTDRLVAEVFRPAFDDPLLEVLHDGAVFAVGGAQLAFSTDSYVVDPLFFPGGDIGALAVNGTVNDLAMCGARPLYLSTAFILEEGLELELLRRAVASMGAAAREAGVRLVTGDTKVVEKGRGHGLYINTAGVGQVPRGVCLAPARVRPGDQILLSGDIGRHGMAVMAAREGLDFETPIESDCACVAGAALALLEAGVQVHCLRDLTRGGLAGALVEIAEGARAQVEIAEATVPVCARVRGACELLGLDPLHVANEGRFAAFVAAGEADRALEVLRAHPQSAGAVCIGQVGASGRGRVVVESSIGARRLLDRLSGEQLPRIC